MKRSNKSFFFSMLAMGCIAVFSGCIYPNVQGPFRIILHADKGETGNFLMIFKIRGWVNPFAPGHATTEVARYTVFEKKELVSANKIFTIPKQFLFFGSSAHDYKIKIFHPAYMRTWDQGFEEDLLPSLDAEYVNHIYLKSWASLIKDAHDDKEIKTRLMTYFVWNETRIEHYYFPFLKEKADEQQIAAELKKAGDVCKTLHKVSEYQGDIERRCKNYSKGGKE